MKHQNESFANTYFRVVFQRINALKQTILLLALATCSYPRLLIETFIRKDFGQRYFSFISNITLSIVMAVIPYIKEILRYDFKWYSPMIHQPLWYGYLAAFLYATFMRRKELKRYGNVIFLDRFSLSTGKTSPKLILWWSNVLGKVPEGRQVECYLEPAPFLVGGILLLLLGQMLGLVLAVAAISYSVSYMGAYYLGDQVLMDWLDKKQVAKGMKSFMTSAGSSDSSNVPIYLSKRPNTPEDGHRIWRTLNDPDDNDAAAVV